jgi:hypothetical protein
MAINIKPDISLSVKPPAAMTLPEMLNMARGAQAYQRESEVFPELVEQSRIATRTAKIGETSAGENLSKTRADKVFSVAGGFINDPRIASGDRNKTVEAMLEIQKKQLLVGFQRRKLLQFCHQLPQLLRTIQLLYLKCWLMSYKRKLDQLANNNCKHHKLLPLVVNRVYSAAVQEL